MDDPTRGLLGSEPPEEPLDTAAKPEAGPGDGDAAPKAAASRPSRDPKFIGDAMRSLYRTSATSIERGDATRVIGRTETESIRPPGSVRPPAPAASTPPPANRQVSSVPAGPRVDVTLWVVLALGLFAIAGVMLSGAL